MASETEADSPIITNYNRFIPEDVLEDLCSRFLINIPDEERADVVRLCFQIELAHWFYIDFYRQENPDLPGCGIKEFTRSVFNKFPFLNKTGENVDQIFANWRKYKLKVPVFGAILINQAFDKCLLVQPAMSKTSWGFPKGKVNKDEEEFDCAIREVLEETGFDMTELADPNNYIEHKIHDHPIRLYVVPGVPENTPFQPQTRGEIRDIRWFEIEYLPTHKKDTNCTEHLNCNPSSFFMVIPFVKDLRKRMSYSFTPRPNSQNSRTMADENIVSTPKAQLQKLVDKEEARIENEKKQAAMDRRRKLQQEKFMAQHALNHPLRSRGYQSPVHERDSPSAREQDEKTPSPIKILQRPEKLSSRDRKESRDRKTGSKQKSFSPSSLHQFVEGSSSRPGNEAFAPFSPIYHAPVSSYSIHPTTGSLPAQPASPYGVSSSIWHLDPSTSMDPLTKLRLLSANASSTHTSKPRTAVQEDEPLSSNRFCFSAPAFENFKFDRQAFSDIL